MFRCRPPTSGVVLECLQLFALSWRVKSVYVRTTLLAYHTLVITSTTHQRPRILIQWNADPKHNQFPLDGGIPLFSKLGARGFWWSGTQDLADRRLVDIVSPIPTRESELSHFEILWGFITISTRKYFFFLFSWVVRWMGSCERLVFGDLWWFFLIGGTNIDDFGGGVGRCVFISSESFVLGLYASLWRSASTSRVLGVFGID